MAKKSASKNTNSKKSAVAFFTENAVARTRASKAGNGGRYNAKTRRLVIPATFAGKSVAVAVADGLVVVGGDGSFKCHPSQHFVTLPLGTVAVSESVTLEQAELPTAVAEAGVDAVAYKLPEAKKSAKKSSADASAKA